MSGSHDHSHDSEEGLQKLPTVDPEMVRLGTQLDAWCLDLKRNVLVGLAPSLSMVVSYIYGRIQALLVYTCHTVEPHPSGPQLSGCSDYLVIQIMIFISFFLLCIKYSIQNVLFHIHVHISGCSSLARLGPIRAG